MSLGRRILKGASAPVIVGTAVFVVAVIVAIIVAVLQGGETIGTPAASALGEQQQGSGSAGSDPPDSALDSGAKQQTQYPSGAHETKAEVFVHVVGEVAKPGVVKLTSGARVTAAIAAAGGTTPAAVLDAVNIARVVTDGEQILIPNAEQVAAGTQAIPPQGDGGANSQSEAAAGALVNINSADVTQLETLPRIGPALAQRILDWRQENGSFTSVEQLTDVPGVGPKIYEGLQERVTV